MASKSATTQKNNTVTLSLRQHDSFTNVLVLTFLIFGFIGILNHEMWGDEIQAWLIARDSSSIQDLFKNLRYESHPGLWHIGLYLVSRFTRKPMGMQVFHLLLATIGTYIFVKFSPFTKLQKVLFSFGYFSFYEYNIISRSYVLGLVFVFLFCKVFESRKNSYILLAAILFLLANTSVYGLIIAISFGLTLLFDCVLEKRTLQIHASKWDVTISVFIFFLGIGSSLIQIIPPSDSSFATDGLAAGLMTEFNPKRLEQTILTVWRSYVPIPDFFEFSFWNSNILIQNSNTLNVTGIVLSLLLFASALMLFVQKRVVLFLYFSGTLGLLLFTYLKFVGWTRHHGHLFILFIACLWISTYYSTSELSIPSNKNFPPTFYNLSVIATTFFKKYTNKFVTLILCTHLAAGTFAFSMDVSSPFSIGKEVAKFIHSQQMDDMLIVGSNNSLTTTLSGYLDRQIYYLNINRLGSFIVWNSEINYQAINYKELIEKINKLITEANKDILLVWLHEVERFTPDINILAMSKFTTESIGPNAEKCYLYLLRKKK